MHWRTHGLARRHRKPRRDRAEARPARRSPADPGAKSVTVGRMWRRLDEIAELSAPKNRGQSLLYRATDGLHSGLTCLRMLSETDSRFRIMR